MPARTTTGVEGIDALMDGGLPRGAAVLVAGESGTGKSVLSLQFILAGIREGEPGVYVTAEDPSRVLENAAALGWDLKGAIEDGYARVVSVQPAGASAPAATPQPAAVAAGPGGPAPGGMPFAGAPGEANGAAAEAPSWRGPAASTIQAVADAVAELQAERVVIDPALPPGATGDEAIAFIADLVRGVLSETHATVLLSGQRLHGAAGFTRLGIEEQLVDGIIELRIVEKDGRRSRAVAVREMRGAKVDLDDRPFSITQGRGIVVGSIA